MFKQGRMQIALDPHSPAAALAAAPFARPREEVARACVGAERERFVHLVPTTLQAGAAAAAALTLAKPTFATHPGCTVADAVTLLGAIPKALGSVATMSPDPQP